MTKSTPYIKTVITTGTGTKEQRDDFGQSCFAGWERRWGCPVFQRESRSVYPAWPLLEHSPWAPVPSEPWDWGRAAVALSSCAGKVLEAAPCPGFSKSSLSGSLSLLGLFPLLSPFLGMDLSSINCSSPCWGPWNASAGEHREGETGPWSPLTSQACRCLAMAPELGNWDFQALFAFLKEKCWFVLLPIRLAVQGI